MSLTPRLEGLIEHHHRENLGLSLSSVRNRTAWTHCKTLAAPAGRRAYVKQSGSAAQTFHASPLRIWLALSAVYVIWGSTYLAIRFTVETIPPFLSAAARFIVSGASLYLWRRATGD